MITLKTLFNVFGHTPAWSKLASASTQAMVSVYLRKLGDTDITKLTNFDLELQYAMSDQPEERKVKARSCMIHLLSWAKSQGKDVPLMQDQQQENVAETRRPKEQKTVSRPKKECSSYTRPPKKPNNNRPERLLSIEDYGSEEAISLLDGEYRGKQRTGFIYYDNGSKGYSKSGKRVYHDCWRAEIRICGEVHRHRSKDRKDCEDWLKAIRLGKIRPTDNKADWWKMEQHKDEKSREDEIVMSAAEEAGLVYDFRQTGDSSAIFEYVSKRLFPHMVCYCAHSLRMGKDKSLSVSRQAIGILLTRLLAGRPITSLTFNCKRMIRIHKSRGDFWYYEKAPKEVKMMFNKIDFSSLAEVWKVTKDRRI